MDDSKSKDSLLRGYTPSGCKITLVSSRRSGKIAHLKNYLDTSSQSKTWGKNLSPFLVGPVDLYDDNVSLTVENAWQYCKVYEHMVDENGNPTEEYWRWAKDGWANPKATRFPLGKGSKPAYSYWDGRKLGYMDARLEIYCRAYAAAVVKTEAWTKLKELVANNTEVFLADPDGYDPLEKGIDFKKALFDTSRALSHSLVLAFLLCENPIWEEFINPATE